MANKIKYGLKNVHYAVATIADDNTATYATPVRIPGAVNLSLDPEGEDTEFHADDIVYWECSTDNGYEGDLEIALVPESFETDVLKAISDSKNVLIEDAEAEPVHFALLFEFAADKKAIRHVMYNCTAARPSVAGQTKENSVEPQTEELSLKARPIHNPALNKNIVKGKTKTDTDETTYTNWYQAVYEPTGL